MDKRDKVTDTVSGFKGVARRPHFVTWHIWIETARQKVQVI